MAKHIGRGELESILASGDFSRLLGVSETSWLEFKRDPYHLADDRNKQELAKDVTALANADGGIILLGVATTREAAHLGDEVKEIHPFTESLVNPEQYHQILSTWVYPGLFQVEIKWPSLPI